MTSTRVASDAERAYYDCPDWCVRWDHRATEDNPENGGHIHYAADIGACGPQGRNGEYEVAVYLPGCNDAAFVSDPDELDRIAADMVQAAQWLREHR